MPEASLTIHLSPTLLGDVANEIRPLLVKVAAFTLSACHPPVETGNLLRSGTFGVEGRGRDMYAFVAFTAPYALFVELGTRYMGAQPYMRPALLSLRAWLGGAGMP